MKGLTLLPKDEHRLRILNHLRDGTLAVPAAAVVLHCSERHVWRLLAAYRRDDVAGIVHGNRGRTPWNRTPEAVRQRVVAFAQSPPLQGANHTHLAELLERLEECSLHPSTVRRILRAAGLRSPQTRRAPRHRSRRERMAQAGMLLQWDGSFHDWLEGRGPALSLVGAIDDATGVPVAAHFRHHEDAHGYFLVLADILRNEGVPLAIYRDRHGIFERRPQEPWTLQEELAGRQFPTQLGRALEELGIRSIAARSPQAKGRIERLWRTLQDRLVLELRLAGATTLGEAEQLLQAFLPRFAAQFAVPAAVAGRAYRPLPAGADLDAVCCFRYQRTVTKDNTVSFHDRAFQLPRRPDGRSRAGTVVDVCEQLDGSTTVRYNGNCLAVAPAPPVAPQLRARKGARSPVQSRLSPTAPAALEGAAPPPTMGPPTTATVSLQLPTHRTPTKPSQNHPWRKGYQARH